jgi:hypothetical protein
VARVPGTFREQNRVLLLRSGYLFLFQIAPLQLFLLLLSASHWVALPACLLPGGGPTGAGPALTARRAELPG